MDSGPGVWRRVLPDTGTPTPNPPWDAIRAVGHGGSKKGEVRVTVVSGSEWPHITKNTHLQSLLLLQSLLSCYLQRHGRGHTFRVGELADEELCSTGREILGALG